MKTWLAGFLITLVAAASLPARSVAEVAFQSSSKQVALLELFTSEGCSSCPPAEARLAALRDDPGLWTIFVPVALHVNYWDRLGWPDKFASKSFTARQHAYAAAWNANAVYTPCFVRNGREWRGRDITREERAAREVGVLSVRCDDSERCVVTFQPSESTRENYDITLALLGGGVVSNVRAGENAGRELRHEFVVLGLTHTALTRDGQGAWRAEVRLPAASVRDVAHRSLAAWVTPRDQLTPIQATGGWLSK